MQTFSRKNTQKVSFLLPEHLQTSNTAH